MSSKAPSVSFLGLPRELRDLILDLVVIVERDARQLETSTAEKYLGGEVRHQLNDILYRSRNRGAGVYYTKDLGRLRLFPTLLVSHQLRAETLSAIDRLPTKHSYRLDIAVVNGDQLWPTWLSIPALTTRVDQVNATIRTCDLMNHLREADHFFIGGLSDYERPGAVWAFYDLLERFLTVRPSTREPDFWSSYGWGETRRTSIKTLDLDVITTGVSLPKDYKANGYYHLAFFDLLNSQFVANFIRKEIESLLSMTREVAGFGAILFEQIGTIRLFRDGVLDREWDLTELLKNLFDDDPADLARPVKGFKKLRSEVWETRRKFGLPFIPEESPLDRLRRLRLRWNKLHGEVRDD